MIDKTQDKTQALWDKLRRPNCTRCPLHESAQTVCLLGDGPTPARWVAIGEAPGEREDEVAHVPFAGNAGKFLDETLAANDLSRDMFYITNAAKCRPPGNRKPKRAEIVACNVFLRAELRIHRPEYVLLLGDAALSATLGIKGIMKHRQRVIKHEGLKYFVALHPAAGLHRPQYKQLFKDDIAAFSRLVNKTREQLPTTVHLVNSQRAFEAFLLKLKEEPRIAFDVETERYVHATKNQLAGTITIFGVSFKAGESWVVPLDHAEAWAPKRWKENTARIADALFIKGKKLIAHNGKYDVRWFLTFKPDAEITFDTMIAAFLLDENRSGALENLALQELHVKPWKSDVQYRRDFPLRKYAIYNAKDCDYTFRLYELYRPQLLAQSKLGKIFQTLLIPTVNIFARIEHRGIYLPKDRLEERTQQARDEEKKVLRRLMRYVPAKLLPFNAGSSEQMARLLYGREGLNLKFPAEAPAKARKANKGLGSTAEGPLKLLNHPIQKIIERWRFLKTKVLATYFLRWDSLRDPAGYVHFVYNLIGAVTGRISSDLHQVPRDPFVRSVLGVEDGWVWGSADFSQAEMRIAAHLSRDPRLLHIFRTNEIDVHTNTAMRITGLPIEKIDSETRKKAKAVNFGFIYGMRENKFRSYAREKFEVEVSLAEAQNYRRGFFDEYRLEAWHDKQIREAKMNGFVRYLDGRQRRLPEIFSASEFDSAEAGRQAINSPVQGLVSDLCLLAMTIGEYGGQGFKPIVDGNFQWQGNMHDEVVFRVRKGFEKEKSESLKYLMENLPVKELFGFEFLVPIISDIKLGRAWAESLG